MKEIPIMVLNPCNYWAQLPRWKKRLHGAATYVYLAFLSLWEPEATDWVIYNELKEQFIEEPRHREVEMVG